MYVKTKAFVCFQAFIKMAIKYNLHHYPTVNTIRC